MATMAQERAPDAVGRTRILKAGPVLWRLNLRTLLLTAVASAVLLLLACWAMTLGSFPVPATEIVRSIAGQGSGEYDFVVQTLRLPRVLVASMVGGCLAMSGAIFQGLVRNPLVSPDIIGINAGATLAAVWWIVTGQSPSLLPLAAFGGATGTAVAIYAFTWRNGISGNRLILVGIGVAAILTAGTTFLMVRYPIEQVSSAVHWSSGTVYGSNWEDVRVLAAALVVLAPLAAILMWPLRVLQFGDDMASGLGMNVEVTRLGLLLTGCALASVAVAIAGPVGFVALMVPHVARMLAGPITGGVILFAALLGSMLVLGADMVAQHALPVSLPVGVITAAVGAPYFLFLLYRSNVRL